MAALSGAANQLVKTAGLCSLASSSPLRVCIVGSGPAGFYTAHQLLKRKPDAEVDIIERLPVPFGLVRFGVAPDHPEVKNCINQFTTLAQSGKCRFIGNVSVGNDISVKTLKSLYHAVVMAYGAEGDRLLGIPGEDLPGVYSARGFVGWYNGLPSWRDLNPDLSGDTAVVFGHGNVALDVARMLLTPVDLLKKTDICKHALEALAESKIRQVNLIGRRGPLQVAFTIKELREMTKLPGCLSNFDPSHFEPIKDNLNGLPRPRKRLTELMVNTASESPGSTTDKKEWGLSFLRSPVEIIPDKTSGRVARVRLEVNKLEGDWDKARAVGTGSYEEKECSLVLCSIGYQALPIDSDVPFDARVGVIPNESGRVGNGFYCSGWVKTGPVGVIATTMSNAFETAEAILEDHKNNKLNALDNSLDLMEVLRNSEGLLPVTFSDWENIDAEETMIGERVGKPREKIVSIEAMLDIAFIQRNSR